MSDKKQRRFAPGLGSAAAHLHERDGERAGEKQDLGDRRFEGAERWRIFLAYRQADAFEQASVMHAALQGRELRLDDGRSCCLEVYWDKRAPAISDFRALLLPWLKSSKAMVLLLSEEASRKRVRQDYLHDEISWWVGRRRTAPVVVDAWGRGYERLPAAMKDKWPRIQVIDATEAFSKMSPPGTSAPALERVIDQIIEGLILSERGVHIEELARLRRLTRVLVTLLAVVLLVTAYAWLKRNEAHRGRQDILRLSALQELDDLTADADRLWPPAPGLLHQYDEWMRRAHTLRSELPDHEAKLSELRTRLLARNSEDSRSGFASRDDTWWHNQLQKLVDGLLGLSHSATGLLSVGASPDHGWGVPRRADFARTVEWRSLSSPGSSDRWREAIRSIADVRECPRYAGLVIEPQLGLLPIGRDPDSGLWEFAHLQSGEPAERAPDGKLEIEDESGLVLVLLPGGAFFMGAQADPGGPNYDRDAQPNEGPVHEVVLSPFFLSKYEMTQGQWLRATGRNPSLYRPDSIEPNNAATIKDPVEQVNWFECHAVLSRMGLRLPTEARWEYGCRAGNQTPWWCGEDPEDLQRIANLADDFARATGAPVSWQYENWSDGHRWHSPVGSFAPNGFGLHDVHGNVWEWCEDGLAPYSSTPARPGDGLREPASSDERCLRGGSFSYKASSSRSALRGQNGAGFNRYILGVRPARDVQ